MLNVLLYALPVIALLAGAFLLYYFFPAAFSPFLHHAHLPNQGVIKRDWVATSISQPKLLKPTPETWINQLNSSCS
jgi:hypothetical protein